MLDSTYRIGYTGLVFGYVRDAQGAIQLRQGGFAVKDLQNMALLFDFYGALLTPRQQELVQAYYLEDLSLAEIAGEDGVSRQAVHDLIKRAEAILLECEGKLGFVREYRERQVRLASLESALRRQDYTAALAALEEIKAE